MKRKKKARPPRPCPKSKEDTTKGNEITTQSTGKQNRYGEGDRPATSQSPVTVCPVALGVQKHGRPRGAAPRAGAGSAGEADHERACPGARTRVPLAFGEGQSPQVSA